MSLETVDASHEYGLRDKAFTACKVGDVDALRGLLQPPGEAPQSGERSESAPSDVPSPPPLLNEPIDSSGFTLLHVASAAAQKAAVRLLLDGGADPACRYENARQSAAERNDSMPELKHYFLHIGLKG